MFNRSYKSKKAVCTLKKRVEKWDVDIDCILRHEVNYISELQQILERKPGR
jgi:hypothetical protein